MFLLRPSPGLIFALLLALSVPAQATERLDALSLHQAAATMRPGEFAWSESAAIGARPRLVVSLALQRLYVYQGDALVGVSTISSGKPGKETPLGDFAILQKARHHRSNLYSNAPMPFMQRLTWDGIALHGGHLPGYPASHGCIRLPTEFARTLFAMTNLGSAVAVARYPLDPPVWLNIEGLEWVDAGLVTGGGRMAPERGRRWGRAPVSMLPVDYVRLDYARSVLLAE